MAPLGVVELLAASDLPIAKTHASNKAAEAAQAAARAAQATARAAKEHRQPRRRKSQRRLGCRRRRTRRCSRSWRPRLRLTKPAYIANMSKKEVIELIRKATSPESDLLTANARVLMSPASTKEQVVALWRQVRETVMASPTL